MLLLYECAIPAENKGLDSFSGPWRSPVYGITNRSWSFGKTASLKLFLFNYLVLFAARYRCCRSWRVFNKRSSDDFDTFSRQFQRKLVNAGHQGYGSWGRRSRGEFVVVANRRRVKSCDEVVAGRVGSDDGNVGAVAERDVRTVSATQKTFAYCQSSSYG